MTSVDLKSVHVDRDPEMALFKNMVQKKGRAHILLIQAEAGMGKSSLLREFWDECEGLQRGRVNLKQMSYTIGEILGELCHQLGSERFERFYDQCQDFARAAGFNIERSTLIGTQIGASLGRLDPEQRKMRHQVLTDVFFDNLVTANVHSQQPIVLQFDTFEAASDEVREWLGGLFLTRVRPHRWLVVVLAGRAIPQLDVDWEEWCLRQTLRPLDRTHVREYIQRVELALSEDVIETLYIISQGRPLDLATFLDRLKKERRSAP